MAKIGSSLPATPATPTGSKLGGRRIGADSGAPEPAAAPAAAPPAPGAPTLPLRLVAATQCGPLTAVPPAYTDGDDWQTIRDTDVFARLYLAANLHPQITDAHVAANAHALEVFWEARNRRLITGDKSLVDYYGPGTIETAKTRLAEAAAALADAAGRAACFATLEKQRQQRAASEMDVYMRPLLANEVLSARVIGLAVAEGENRGFTLPEAEEYVTKAMRAAGFAPVRTVNQSPNLLLATWTPGGKALANQPFTKVMGQDVYTLADAARVLYDALVSGDEKAVRNLDSLDYTTNVARELREHDTAEDLKEIGDERKLDKTQKRLKSLYLLGPELPFHAGGSTVDFATPAELLSRAARSARDFAAAETAFRAGHLHLWVRAGAPRAIKDALPEQTTALAFRQFLHRAVPTFPLRIDGDTFAKPADLAAFIRRDENTWKLVYGSFTTNYVATWLHALGRADVVEATAHRFEALLDNGVSDKASSEMEIRLQVQALLEALDPKAATPTLETDLDDLDLTGLSGEETRTLTLTLTNPTGGYQFVNLGLDPALDGVTVAPTELFFDQRAPGQQLTVTITGDPTRMPRDGQHAGQVVIQTAYGQTLVPVRAEAVFPQKLFALFVGGAAAAMALIFGVVRYWLGGTLGGDSQFASTGPVQAAVANGTRAPFFWHLLLLVGLLVAFAVVLRRLSNPKSAN